MSRGPRCDCLLLHRILFGGRAVRGRWIWLTAALAVASLLPWMRNHGFLDDLYDYGLVMSGVGRIAEGERPYRDFVTPIQTGVFLVNGAAETVFGSTYRGMTRGALVLTALSFLAMVAVLARGFGVGAAVLLGAALTWLTHAQHTIIWYNATGVLLLALVAWSGAMAPVWRREDRGWNLLMAAALVAGGANKISFQLIAVAFALGWAWRAGLRGRANGREVAVSTGMILACGALVPAVLEMLWTGAGPGAWWHNVVSLPAGGRSGDLPSVLKLEFFLSHQHNYYGRLAVPFVGLVGVVLTLAVVGVGWLRMPTRDSRLDCALLAAAALLALGGGIGLLATNQDIAYVSLAGWLVLLIALWIGFDLGDDGWARAVLVGPLMVLGVLAWQAAWSGQRALWGYSTAARADYVDGGSVHPDFAYLRGTRVPPELARSLGGLVSWRAGLPAADRESVFYGGGTEWLERVWPATKVSGMPLWFAFGTNFGPAEQSALDRALGPEGVYRHALVSIARDVWFGGTINVLERGYARQLVGPVIYAYSRVVSEGVSVHPLEFIADHGGNLDSNLLASTMGSRLASGGRQFLGVTTGRGEMTLLAPSYRLRGEAVLTRAVGTPDGDLAADFTIVALRDPEPPIDLWIQRLTLPAGQPEVFVPYEIGGGGMPVRFSVTILPGSADRLVAGWRNPTLQHAMETSAEPPRLHHTTLDFLELDAAAQATVLPGDWRPRRMIARGGTLTPDGLVLVPGGELWVRPERPVGAFAGTARLADPGDSREPPLVRAFYYKGGRLELTSQAGTGEEGRLEFRVWSAEPDGWLVLSVDPNPRAAPLLFKVTEVRE